MSNGTSKKATGRIVGINFEEQALDISFFEGLPAKDILTKSTRLYVNDALFRNLVKIICSSWSNAKICVEGCFYTQGKVLMHYECPSRLDSVQAFTHLVNNAIGREPSK